MRTLNPSTATPGTSLSTAVVPVTYAGRHAAEWMTTIER